MKYLKASRLYCFSPPVMIATFVIEIALAIYTYLHYKSSPVTRLVIAILVCLAVFQLAEYNVCEGAWGISSLGWAKLGFIAITFLPPLGIHLATRIAGEKSNLLVAGAYTTAIAFSTFFLVAANGVSAGACLGNYVIFEQAPGVGNIYGAYYYGLLFIGIISALWFAKQQKPANIRRALTSLVVGYVLFILPTTIVNLVDPSTIVGIPSIMCGFAVMLAAIISNNVLPAYHKEQGLVDRVRQLLTQK